MKSVIKSKMYLAVVALLCGMLSLSACGGGGSDDPVTTNKTTNANVTGYWETTTGDNSTWHLTQNGNAISGFFTGSDSEELTGSIEGSDITLSFSYEEFSQIHNVTLTGSVSGSSMSGSWTDGNETGTWSASLITECSKRYEVYGAQSGDYDMTPETHTLVGTSQDGSTSSFDISGYDRFFIYVPACSPQIKFDAIGLDSQWLETAPGNEYANYSGGGMVPSNGATWGASDGDSDSYVEGPPDGITIESTQWERSMYGFTTLGASTISIYIVEPVDTSSDTINHNGFSYGTVISSTGKTWLDRNLGASQVATAYNDAAAYGDLYQWGRSTDGHEKRDSPTTSTLSSTDDPGHGSFITASSLSDYDWRSPQNDNLWQGESGVNNPCPTGFRLPTEVELDTERASWPSKDKNGAYASPLRLVAAGDRIHENGSLNGAGSHGSYWSSTVSGGSGRGLGFGNDIAFMHSASRALGFSVRCIEDETL